MWDRPFWFGSGPPRRRTAGPAAVRFFNGSAGSDRSLAVLGGPFWSSVVLLTLHTTQRAAAVLEHYTYSQTVETYV